MHDNVIRLCHLTPAKSDELTESFTSFDRGKFNDFIKDQVDKKKFKLWVSNDKRAFFIFEEIDPMNSILNELRKCGIPEDEMTIWLSIFLAVESERKKDTVIENLKKRFNFKRNVDEIIKKVHDGIASNAAGDLDVKLYDYSRFIYHVVNTFLVGNVDHRKKFKEMAEGLRKKWRNDRYDLFYLMGREFVETEKMEYKPEYTFEDGKSKITVELFDSKRMVCDQLINAPTLMEEDRDSLLGQPNKLLATLVACYLVKERRLHSDDVVNDVIRQFPGVYAERLRLKRLVEIELPLFKKYHLENSEDGQILLCNITRFEGSYTSELDKKLTEFLDEVTRTRNYPKYRITWDPSVKDEKQALSCIRYEHYSRANVVDRPMLAKFGELTNSMETSDEVRVIYNDNRVIGGVVYYLEDPRDKIEKITKYKHVDEVIKKMSEIYRTRKGALDEALSAFDLKREDIVTLEDNLILPLVNLKTDTTVCSIKSIDFDIQPGKERVEILENLFRLIMDEQVAPRVGRKHNFVVVLVKNDRYSDLGVMYESLGFLRQSQIVELDDPSNVLFVLRSDNYMRYRWEPRFHPRRYSGLVKQYKNPAESLEILDIYDARQRLLDLLQETLPDSVYNEPEMSLFAAELLKPSNSKIINVAIGEALGKRKSESTSVSYDGIIENSINGKIKEITEILGINNNGKGKILFLVRNTARPDWSEKFFKCETKRRNFVYRHMLDIKEYIVIVKGKKK